MKKLIYPIVKYSLITLLLLVILLVISLTVAVKTATGTRYLLAMIPGLTVEASQGSLSGGWSAKQLTWQDTTIKVSVTNPTFTWYASCLFKADICIDQLSAAEVAIDLSEKSEQTATSTSSNTGIVLPTINLPVTIHIKQVSLAKLAINQQTIIEDAQLTALIWQKATVSFAKLTATYQQQANTELTGQISLANDWPLQLQGQLNLTGILQQPWTVTIKASGELQKQLTANINSQGFLKASLEAKAAVLDEKIPAELSLTAQDFNPNSLADIPETLLVKQFKLTAIGDLQQGYKLQSDAILAGHTTPVQLTTTGLLTAQALQLEQLRLSTSSQQFATINGQLNWATELSANAHLNYQSFPWFELYPLASPPPVTLDTLQATVNYQQSHYQAELKGKLTGPAGPFLVSTEAQGNLQEVSLTKLLVNTPDKGSIKGQAKLTFDPHISWLADINLNTINPNYWLADLKGQLQGTIHSDGNLINQQLTTNNNIAINGTLGKQKAVMRAQFIAKNEQWRLPELLLQVGGNQINGHAQLDKQLQAQLDLNLPALKQILPSLTGKLKGQVTLAGTIEKPQANIKLTGQQLGFQEQRILSLELTAHLNQQQQGQLSLNAYRIKTGDTLLGNLNLNGSGNLTKQQLQLQLTEGIVTLLTHINTQQDSQKNWNVAVNKLQINSQQQQWQLQQPAILRYSAAGALTLEQHCLQNDRATLCGIGQQKLLPETQINYQLANFPLQSLRPWLPENFNWQGILSAKINLKLPKQGPLGHIDIDASNGSFQLRETTEDDWHNYPYSHLYITSELTANKVTSSLNFTGGPLGNISANLAINPVNLNKPIKGDFKIGGLDLNIFQPFIPQLEQLTGKINGLGTISGTLEKPYVSGKIALNDGNVVGDLPISLEQLQIVAMIEGEELKLSGNWRSGKAGYGSLKGAVNWSKALDVNLALQANKLPVIVAPYAELEAATDLTLKMQDNALSLTGTVQIPKGEITVRDLPPSTVKVSSDAIIVKDQSVAQQQTLPLQLNMDINVLIGEERVKFSGFGLTSDVTGKLKIANNLLTHGEVNLNDGQFRAYGQRLEIRRARIIFAGSLTEPMLDIEAVRVVEDVTAGLKVTGLTSQPKVTIFSNPTMSQEQALSYIILGRPMGVGDSNMLARTALVMGVAGGAPILGDLASEVGIDDFQLDTEGSGDNTSVVASGKITDKLSVHYGINVFQAVNSLMVRYKLTKTIYLEAASGVASSLDLFYKKSF